MLREGGPQSGGCTLSGYWISSWLAFSYKRPTLLDLAEFTFKLLTVSENVILSMMVLPVRVLTKTCMLTVPKNSAIVNWSVNGGDSAWIGQLDALDWPTFVNGFTNLNDIYDTAECCSTDKNHDRCTGVNDFGTTNETFNGTDWVFTKMWCDLKNKVTTTEVLDSESIKRESESNWTLIMALMTVFTVPKEPGLDSVA